MAKAYENGYDPDAVVDNRSIQTEVVTNKKVIQDCVKAFLLFPLYWIGIGILILPLLLLLPKNTNDEYPSCNPSGYTMDCN